MKIRLKIEDIKGEIEMLSSYRGAKRSEGGEDYERVRILEGFDDDITLVFAADGAALLAARTAGKVEISVGNIVQGGEQGGEQRGEQIDAEGPEIVKEMAGSFLRHYILARWYSKLRLDEWKEMMDRAFALADGMSLYFSVKESKKKIKIARRRRLPPI